MIKESAQNPEITSGEKITNYFFMILLLVLAFLIGFYKIHNYDIWWHLKTGELIVKNGIPKTEPFSFTAYGRHWTTHEWLAQVIFYLAYRLGGLTLLIVIKGLITSLTAYILYRFALQKRVHSAIAAAVIMLAIAGISFRIFARPHLFTFVTLTLLVVILFDDNTSARSFFRRRWIYLPLIMLLWANMQAGFFIGLGIYWIVVIKEIFLGDRVKSGLNDRIKRYIPPALLASLICFVNPNGIKLFEYPIRVAANPLFKNTISEWVSPLYLGQDEWLAKAILAVMLIIAVIIIVLNIKKRPHVSLIVFIAGIASLWAMRNVADFMIIAAAGLLSTPTPARMEFTGQKIISRYILVPLALIWVFGAFSLVRGYQAEKGRLGLTIKKGFFPDGATEFLKARQFKGNIVNILQDGGYLTFHGYPDWKIFIDGRLVEYGSDQLNNYRLVVEGRPGAIELLDELRAGAAVLPMPPKMGRLRNLLSADEKWTLVYFDDYYLVYLRKNPANDPVIREYGYKLINPLKTGYSSVKDSEPAAFLAEARRAVALDSSSALTNSVLGYALEVNSDYANAAGAYKIAFELNPLLEGNILRIGHMFARAAMFDSALTWYGKAVEVEPGNAQYQYYLGLTYYVLEDMPQARQHLQISQKLYPAGPAKDILGKMGSP